VCCHSALLDGGMHAGKAHGLAGSSISNAAGACSEARQRVKTIVSSSCCPCRHHLLIAAQAKASGAGKAVKNMPKGAGKGGAKSTGR